MAVIIDLLRLLLPAIIMAMLIARQIADARTNERRKVEYEEIMRKIEELKQKCQ
jgi:hypothetical protein